MSHVCAAVADDDDIAGDLRRPCAGVRQFAVDDGVGFPDFHAGSRVERMQTAIYGSHEYFALPNCNTAIHKIAAGISSHEVLGLRVITPQLPAGHGVDCVHVTPCARCVHHSVDDQRSGFLAALGLAQVVAPGKTQLFDIVLVDRRQRRIVRAVLVATAHEPVLRLPVRTLQPRRVQIPGGGSRCAERRTRDQCKCGADQCFVYSQGASPGAVNAWQPRI